ncbi:S1 RNA-binding domain-containing protein [Chitinivibrio alkaliphilus]|uniref:Ribosomal protein S1 n=1 Tax=Chitinivibrio alkaliphilus ACht1 TaxID=1313304 RepID=U7D5W8_9BACT|nr:S1 RNA-binding domain-containing protein [Chitinivibrio alkaliphilus]ERP31899.1 ribosomal protein S1 [Chitinivibrio alkaliphilus ACht1]
MSNSMESSKELAQSHGAAAPANAASTPEGVSEAKTAVEVVVQQVDDVMVSVTLPDGTEGRIPRKDIDSEELTSGDSLSALVLSSSEGAALLSASMVRRKKAGMKLLRTLKDESLPVQGRITGMNKGGYNINFLGRKAFCPFSTVDVTFPDVPQELMGKELDFVIARIENRGDNIVLTRIPLLQDEIRETIETIEAACEQKTPLNGKVTRVTNFGAFVDLGGVEGLVHISELTWDREEKTESVVREGENISVMVLEVTRNEELHESRISLSVKRLESNPWEEALQKYSLGDVVEAPVSRIVGFGAFIKLMPGVEALIRTEEMGWTRIRKPSREVSRGQMVRAKIIEINEEEHKIDCSMKEFADNPWKDVAEKYTVGESVTATVSGVQDYGYFVDLDEQITGLLRNKRIGKDISTPLKKGDTLEVRIDEVDTEECRIALSCGDVPAEEPQRRPRKSSHGTTAPSASTKTTPGDTDFAAALRNALKQKK